MVSSRLHKDAVCSRGSDASHAGPAAPRARGDQGVLMSKPGKIRCDACPVMCYIADGKAGACDRYANENSPEQLARDLSALVAEE